MKDRHGRALWCDDQATHDSIAAARADRDRERREIERTTGVQIREDGTVVLPVTPA